MAKRVIAERYTFDASTRTVTVIGKVIRRETLVLILNVTTNTVIYNFADAALRATSYSVAVDSTTMAETTAIVLNYNTTGMSNTDQLSIIVDEVNELLYPAEVLMDPVQKLRVSTPQALIDTDFEYGTQPTKWETLTLTNNRASYFYDTGAPITNFVTAGTFFGASGNYQITNIAGNGTRLVTVSITNTTGITVNTPVFIQDTIDPNANGWFLPFSVTTNSNFTYYALQNVANQSIYDITKTYVWIGNEYSFAGVPVSVTAGVAFTYSGSIITATTVFPHGLSIGNPIMLRGLTATTNPPNGVHTVRTTPTNNTFTFDATGATGTPTGTIGVTAAGSGLTVNTTVLNGGVVQLAINAAGTGYSTGDILNISGGGGNARLKITAANGGIPTAVAVHESGTGYSTASAVATTLAFSCNTLTLRHTGSSIHRPWDGGVNFTCGTPYNGNQTIRQTRRYFRYQSGKGMQFSTGCNLSPPIFVDNVTSSGTTVTVNTRFPHNLGAGAILQVTGCTETEYNGTFAIVSTPTLQQLTYTALSSPSAATATGTPVIQAKNWYGAAVRTGMFDSQNGFYWEYDGQQMYAVLRSSTQQLSGFITSLGTGAQIVTGTNTLFTTQLVPYDYIVIRGQSYIVQQILSNTSLQIYPEYRGTAITFPSQVTISKTINTRIPQSSFNIDRLDGTGQSGYTLDPLRMQMWYIDYSWYGAGAIRFGVKDQRGEIKYCHRISNSGRNTEAYMRSGNLPARYEVNTNWPYTTLAATLTSGEVSTMTVTSTANFPSSGTLVVTNGGVTTGAVIEYIGYTAKTSTTFTGLTRALTNLTGPGGLTAMGGTNTATTFTYSATAPINIALYSPQAGITLGHWGSAVTMDGRYDDDKSFVFNYGQNAQQTFPTAGVRYPVFSLRLAPSVDQGLTGLLGAREIINRMQLTLRQVGVFTTTASVRVELIINGRITGTPGTWTPVGGSSLAQYATHSTNSSITGGESIFNFFAPSGGLSTQSLELVRDLGNSILGGGLSFTNTANDQQKYPDGPDQVTVCVTPLAVNAAVAARVNWTEAQA